MTRLQVRNLRRTPMLVGALLALVAACGKAPPPALPPAAVEVVTVKAGSVALEREFVGRLSATRSADVRARVAGVLRRRTYVEGSEVHAGQTLFEIDPATLEAALHGAIASLAQAHANATNAQVAATRMREVAKAGLVSRSALDDAEAIERSTAAAVQQATANVEAARIQLGYATVTAPISGRAGQQRVTEGALVGQDDATLLTTIDQVDPLYVNFTQPADDYEQLQRAQQSGSVTLFRRDATRVEVRMSDGTAYAHPGTIDFSDVSVDATTGAIALRATLPNPDRQLLPGMYVNLRVTLGERKHAYLVPQVALQRDNNGPFVDVVDGEDKVAVKPVTAEMTQGASWVITSGLTDGDRVIVAGIQQARPGSRVAVTAAQAPAKADSPSTAAAGGPPR
jgi:membrane fusion protein, multidrug efflux system